MPRSFEPPQRVKKQTAQTTMNLCSGASPLNHFSSFANGFFSLMSKASHRRKNPAAVPTSHGVAALIPFWIP